MDWIDTVEGESDKDWCQRPAARDGRVDFGEVIEGIDPGHRGDCMEGTVANVGGREPWTYTGGELTPLEQCCDPLQTTQKLLGNHCSSGSGCRNVRSGKTNGGR